MPSPIPTNSIEGKLHAATRLPAPRAEFLAALRGQLAQQSRPPLSLSVQAARFFRRHARAALILVLAGLIVSVALVGPQRVLASMRQLLGYLPGVGVVDQSAPLRVLVEAVSLTREGVTVSVNRATLSADRTQIDFGVAGVPLSAYPAAEAVTGCVEHWHLRLPDGTRLAADAPVPASVSQATFVLPCIFNTLPGAAPEDWELPLRFVAAPPDLVVLPIVEVTPPIVPPATATQSATHAPVASPPAATATSSPVEESLAGVSIDKVIETADGYILIGAIRLQAAGAGQAQVTGALVLRDANRQTVPYTFPPDLNEYDLLDLEPGDVPFSLQVAGAGLAFPLTFEIPGIVITPGDPQARAELTFNAGPSPQPGQEWVLNRPVEIGGYALTLVSVTADSLNGYSFSFEADSSVYGLRVEVDGHTALGGGGGTDGQGSFSRVVSYAELPTGTLKVILSNLTLASETQFWQGSWQPESVRSDWAAATPATVCLFAEAIGQLPTLPAGLDGRALLSELNPQQQIVLVGLDGSERQVLVPQASRGALSRDGLRLAYPDSEGITIVELATVDTTALNGLVGRDLSWSPDGTRIAYVSAGSAYGVFVASLDGGDPRQLSDLGYETIAGWSPDGTLLYYAIPSASNDGFLLRAADIASGEVRDLFVLPNSSLKAPMPAVSPDGKWIAYRGQDSASLYVMGMDGGESRQVIAAPSGDYPITGIVWGPSGGLLGVSLNTLASRDGEILLLQLEACEAYRLPTMHGELEGLLIP
ncbi:MAG: PD40 domain-containing protein [Anaerolineales bacterium]|nr:PD40 domain-containing protein [Anaerolineales bacterium]